MEDEEVEEVVGSEVEVEDVVGVEDVDGVDVAGVDVVGVDVVGVSAEEELKDLVTSVVGANDREVSGVSGCCVLEEVGLVFCSAGLLSADWLLSAGLPAGCGAEEDGAPWTTVVGGKVLMVVVS